jgi:uncharacterized protein YuzE
MADVHQVSVQVGEWRFDRAAYDAAADVLYLHVGDPAGAVEFDSSDEGHHLRYDADGHVVGLTIVNARRLLERDGEIVVTPPALHLRADEIAPAFAGAA